MSILTPFFNLIKPAKQDGVKVSDFNANMDTIDTEMHRPPLSVNFIEPDPSTRNIPLQSVPLADNLTSDEAQINIGTYLERTSGGSSSIESGDASLSTIKGNMIKTGYVAEVIDMTVNAVPRVAPPAITATIDNATFEAYVETAGTYTLTYTDGWDEDPTDYGITVTNSPVDGDEIVVVWDGENDPVMTVNAVERPVPPAITATIDKATFRAYVATSGTVTLSYTSAWSASPALYGITVQNTPVSGDSIVVDYVKENRGTITPANVSAFNSTGWNLYDNDTGYAKVIKYSDTYGYYIGGNYSIVAFATTPTGTPSAVTVNDGYFNIPSDGYIIITGGDATTYIFPTWSDWVDGYEGDFEPYTVDTINLSSIMVSFTAGLCAIGEVRDELNFNIQKAYSRIDRLAYTAENLAAVIASGRAYDTDTNYIYVVRETPVEYSFSIDGTYAVSDHGIEYFTASTTTPVICETLYGENLKDKLRTDVVTISQQTLSANQQAQVRENIGAANVSEMNRFAIGVNIAANTDLNEITTPGVYCCANADTATTCLHCPTGGGFTMYVAYKSIETQSLTQALYGNNGVWYLRGKTSGGFGAWYTMPHGNNFAYTLDFNTTTASRSVSKGSYVFYNGNLHTVNSDITQGESNFGSKLSSVSGGVLNVLNSKTSWTSVSDAVSAGSKFTLDTCICYKFGYLTVLAFTVIASSTYGTSDSLITGIPSSYRPVVNISSLWTQLTRNGNTYNYISNAGARTDGTARQGISSNGQIGDTISAIFIFPNE